jgi:mannan endo-1,6-alpha-mannosidase
MYEAACQNSGNCNNDQRTFKAYFSRFLGSTAQMVPETNETIYALLDASARGASSSCSGGTDGHTCGLNWFKDGGGWDGYYGLGEQMSALEVMQNLRIRDRPAPYTAETGGTSVGDPAAGTETTQTNLSSLQLDGGDTAGAAIITAVVSLSIIASVVWILL